ncbi:MAG: TolC family protein [Pirellulales bacterium]|nr:TolC family protein [Pirellulales bacterium]
MAESLSDAWTLAVANNAQLAASKLQEEAAQYDLDATTAERIPSAWLRSSYTLRSDSPSFRILDPIPGVDSFRFPYTQREAAGVAAHVRVPIYTSGRIKHSILGAQSRLAAEQYDAMMARNELMLAVGESYLAVLRAQRELTVADQNLAALSAHEAKVRCFFDQKRVAGNELLAAQVSTASAQQGRLRMLSQLEIARGKYNRLLGRPLETPVQLEEIILPMMQRNLEELKQMARQERPDLLQVRASVDAQMSESRRIQAAGLPQVSALGSYEFEENRYNSPEGIASASVIVDWNFFDRQRKSRVVAEITRAASLNRLVEDLSTRIELEILTAWNDRHTAIERLKVATQALEHAEESLRIAQVRFMRGMNVSSDVLDAQHQRIQMERDYYNSAYDQTLSELRLRYAAGILGNGH